MTQRTRHRKHRFRAAVLVTLLATGTSLVATVAPATASVTSVSCGVPNYVDPNVVIKRTTVTAGSKRVMTSAGLDCTYTNGIGTISLVKSTMTLTGNGLDADLPPDPGVQLVPGSDVIAGQWRVHAAEIGGFQTLCHGGDRIAPYQTDNGTVVLRWMVNGVAKTSTVVARAEMPPPDDGQTIAFGIFPCTPWFIQVSGTVKAGVLKGSHFEASLLAPQDPAATTAQLIDVHLTDGPQDEPADTTPLLECSLASPTAQTIGTNQPGTSPSLVRLKVASGASPCADSTGSGITAATKVSGTLLGVQDNDFSSSIIPGETPIAGNLVVKWNALNPANGRPWTSTLTGELTYAGIVPIGEFGITAPRYLFQGHVTAGKALYADVDMTLDLFNCSPLFQPQCAQVLESNLSIRYPWTAS